MTTAAIDRKIETAYKQSEVLSKQHPTWQEEVDNLLDRMNELTKWMGTLERIVLRINFEIERDMAGFKKSDKGYLILEKFIALSFKMMNVIRKSDLYPGVKTAYANLKQELAYLNELIADRKIALELEEDDEMKKIIEVTLKAK